MAIKVPKSNPVVKAKKLWQLLGMALRDLAKAEKTKGVQVDMDSWYTWDTKNKTCTVCLAGAVMRSRLPPKPPAVMRRYVVHEASAWPADYGKDIEPKLLALNILRQGEVDEAVKELHSKTKVRYKGQLQRARKFMREELLTYLEQLYEPFGTQVRNVLRSFPDYDSELDLWWKTMRFMVKKLKELDL